MSYLPPVQHQQQQQRRRTSIILATPHYGNVSPGSCRAVYQYAARDCDVHIADTTSSLLAHGFNMAWVSLLNALDEGLPVDFFAMLHSDVEPAVPESRAEPPWLSVLMGELERTGSDVMSVTIPIKDGRGLVSTGVGNPENPWEPLFRLTMRQVAALPETFGNADMGHPDKALLVNTGCWAAKVGDWMREFPGFTIRDRIVRRKVRTPQGEKTAWVAEVEPEDWMASRWFHQRGLKVMATRKVKLAHVGTARFVNDEAWGDYDFDRDTDAAAAAALSERLKKVGGAAG